MFKFNLAPHYTAVVGMKEGGRRRVLVPPQAGWVDGNVKPQPATFGAGRRLENHREEPLLMEVDLVRIRKSDEPMSEEEMRDELLNPEGGNFLFKLPAGVIQPLVSLALFVPLNPKTRGFHPWYTDMVYTVRRWWLKAG